MAKLKLFLLPYAGGSTAVYYRWAKYFGDDIEIFPVELSGRGKRFDERLYENFNSIVDDITGMVIKQIQDSKYAIFGHSMGSLLTFGVCKKLIGEGYEEPVHVFVSGRYPPHVKNERKIYHLPDQEFIDEIIKLGGSDKALFENKELLAIFLPILRADYKIIETYDYQEDEFKLNCGITAFHGKNDPNVSFESMLEWRSYTKKPFSIYQYEGDHFFINKFTEEIIQIIKDKVEYLNNSMAIDVF